MSHAHEYEATLVWDDAGKGPTFDYESYSRQYTISVPGKAPMRGSGDPSFKGDAGLHNPEELLVVSLSACHMLTYLALCARAGIGVVSYEDRAWGTMTIKDKRLRMTDVLLRPRVAIAPGADREKALALHEQAQDLCFIANSVNFPVRHEAQVAEAAPGPRAASS